MATPLSDSCTQGIVLSKFADMVDCALAREDALRVLARRLETQRDALAAALMAVARGLEHTAEALRIDGRNVGAYTKHDAEVHCNQLADQARAALAPLDKS